MLDYNEYKKISELKKKIAKSLGAIEYEFSEAEIDIIIKEIEKLSEDKRSKTAWRQIAKTKTGVKDFSLNEALEVSDINYLYQQIQDILNKNK